jgi:hypothetical protein
VALFPNSTLAHAGVFFDVPIEPSLQPGAAEVFWKRGGLKAHA